jgi:hypothetical protein
MAISKLDKIVIVVAVLAIVGVLLPLAWLSSLQVSITPLESLRLKDVQFEEDYLNITVENTCTEAKIVNEVTVRDLEAYGYGFSVDWTSTPHTVAVYEPVLAGEEISFRVSFKWTSGCAYQIELETADTEDWSPATAYNAVAP